VLNLTLAGLLKVLFPPKLHMVPADMYQGTIVPSGFSSDMSSGASTRVRFCIRIAERLRARFAYKGFRVLIILWTPITSGCKQISGKNDQTLN
jgi:hypothetical protein